MHSTGTRDDAGRGVVPPIRLLIVCIGQGSIAFMYTVAPIRESKLLNHHIPFGACCTCSPPTHQPESGRSQRLDTRFNPDRSEPHELLQHRRHPTPKPELKKTSFIVVRSRLKTRRSFYWREVEVDAVEKPEEPYFLLFRPPSRRTTSPLPHQHEYCTNTVSRVERQDKTHLVTSITRLLLIRPCL